MVSKGKGIHYAMPAVQVSRPKTPPEPMVSPLEHFVSDEQNKEYYDKVIQNWNRKEDDFTPSSTTSKAADQQEELCKFQKSNLQDQLESLAEEIQKDPEVKTQGILCSQVQGVGRCHQGASFQGEPSCACLSTGPSCQCRDQGGFCCWEMQGRRGAATAKISWSGCALDLHPDFGADHRGTSCL